MTESEWRTCTDPKPMLEFLRGKASDRKLRLFAVACCRLVLKKVRVSPVAEHEVDVAERYADGAASTEELAGFADPHPCADDAALIEKVAHARYSKDAHFACLNAAEIEGGALWPTMLLATLHGLVLNMKPSRHTTTASV